MQQQCEYLIAHAENDAADVQLVLKTAGEGGWKLVHVGEVVGARDVCPSSGRTPPRAAFALTLWFRRSV